MTASSGMTFSLSPACSEPMVTTADSVAATSRATMPCRRITVAAAITTGSMLACGIEPWAPRPKRRICRLSAAEVMVPVRPATSPAGPTITCWPSTTSGFWKRSNSPSSIIARAPSAVSSPGWNTAIRVPLQPSRARAIKVAAPASQATCMSWPQACATGTVLPAASVAVAVLAYGRPVASFTGSASMSARSITVGPSPLRSSPTTPVRPTPVVTS